MSFRFRKSIVKGPFRINLSKSGIGYSVGNKFFRLTKKASGGTRTTASIPGTGIAYVKDSKRENNNKKRQRGKATEVTKEVEASKTKQKKPFYKKWWFWLIVVCVVVSPLFSDDDVESDNASESIIEQSENVQETQNAEDKNILEEVTADMEGNQNGQQSSPEKTGTAEQEQEIPAHEQEVEVEAPNQENASVEEETVAPLQEGATDESDLMQESALESAQSVQSEQETTPNTEQVQVMVWIPESGTKYHSDPDCSGMINPTKVTLEEAIAMGYEACKRCH